MNRNFIKAVSKVDFFPVEEGGAYNILLDDDLIDGEQFVEVYNYWTQEYYCRMRLSHFEVIEEV